MRVEMERQKSRMTPRLATWDSGWTKAWFVKREPLGRGSVGKQTVSSG